MGQGLFYSSSAGKLCLAHGLRHLTLDTIYDVSCLQTLLTRSNEKLRMTFEVAHHTTYSVNILFKTLIFPVIGRKIISHRSPIETQKSQPLGSTDNAGNLVNIVSGIIRLLSGWYSFMILHKYAEEVMKICCLGFYHFWQKL